MPKPSVSPDPALEESRKQFRIWWRDIEEYWDAVPEAYIKGHVMPMLREEEKGETNTDG